MANDPATVAKIEELLTAILKYADPRKAGTEWKQVYRLLQTTDLAPGRVTGLVGMRGVAALAWAIEQLPPPVAPEDIPDEEICRKAMQAFRKRLSLTILDEESKLGRGPLSKGAGGGVAAVVPPAEWPATVWKELERQGKIHEIGHGLFELTKK